MSKPFGIKVGSQLPVLEEILVDDDTGVPVSLVGATVKFAMRRVGTTAAIINNAATIVKADADVGDPDRGRVQYVWGAGETAAAGIGDYEGEFLVTLANGSKGAFPSGGYIPITVLGGIAS